MKDREPASCKWCIEPKHIKQGRIWLCKKHYRFQQMRAKAKSRGLVVPSYERLGGILNENLVCHPCGRKMVWLSEENTSLVITLQHDRNGCLRLICRSCNTRHSKFSGDTFYSAPRTKKICPRCKILKPLMEFYLDNSKRWKNRKTYCKKCSDFYQSSWVSKNKGKFNAKRREYYHERIASGNPIPR